MSDRAGSRGQRLPALVTLALLTEAVAYLAAARTSGNGPIVGRWPYNTFVGLLYVALGLGWAAGSRVGQGLRARAGSFTLPTALGRWLPLMPAAAVVFALHVRGLLRLGPLLVFGGPALGGALLLLLAIMLGGRGRRARPHARVALIVSGALVAGLALRTFELTLIPLDPGRGDMLPLAILATRNALAGHPPYTMYHFPWEVPLTYLPLGWLPYGLLSITPFDARWTSALAELTVVAALLFASRRPDQRAARDAAVCLWAAWFVSSRLVAYDGTCAAAPQWAALAWVAALAVERSRWTPVMLGCALATSLLAVPLLPFVGLAWYAARRSGRASRASRARSLRALLRASFVLAFVAAVLVVPWFLWSPRGFVEGVVVWFNDLDAFPRAKWQTDGAWAGRPGLTGAFWTFGLERLLKPLQMAALAGLVAFHARTVVRRWSRASLGPVLPAAMLLFLSFNSIIWSYLWEAALVLGLVALAADRSTTSSSPRSSSPAAS